MEVDDGVNTHLYFACLILPLKDVWSVQSLVQQSTFWHVGTSSCALLGRFLHFPVDAQERVGGLGHTVTTGDLVRDSSGGSMCMCPGQRPCSRMVGNMVNEIAGSRLDEEKREQPPDTPWAFGLGRTILSPHLARSPHQGVVATQCDIWWQIL